MYPLLIGFKRWTLNFKSWVKNFINLKLKIVQGIKGLFRLHYNEYRILKISEIFFKKCGLFAMTLDTWYPLKKENCPQCMFPNFRKSPCVLTHKFTSILPELIKFIVSENHLRYMQLLKWGTNYSVTTDDQDLPKFRNDFCSSFSPETMKIY